MTWVHLGHPAPVCFDSCSYRGKAQISDQKLNRGPTACPLCPGHTPAGAHRSSDVFRVSWCLWVQGGRQEGLPGERKRQRPWIKEGLSSSPGSHVLSRFQPQLSHLQNGWVQLSSDSTAQLCPQCSETSAVFEGQGGDSPRSCGWMHYPPPNIQCFRVP